MSRGKYVWLISADDLFQDKNALERFVNVMERNPRVGYTFCRTTELQGLEKASFAQWTNCGNEDRIWKGRTFLRRLVKSNCVVMSSGMVRRECYEKVALHPLDMPHASDWYLWCVFALRYDVAYFAKPMVCFRRHDKSLTSLFNQESSRICLTDGLVVLWRVAREAELAGLRSLRRACNASIAAQVGEALKSKSAGSTKTSFSQTDFKAMLERYSKDSRDRQDICARLHMVLGDKHYWDGNYSEAIRLYWLAIRVRPLWPWCWSKYCLLRLGRAGIYARRLVFRLWWSTAGGAPDMTWRTGSMEE